jgi:hypothetical protein
MSAIARTGLRLSAVAALRGVTICGDNIFDSRIEAVNFRDELPVAGSIAVYTEQDSGDALSQSQGGPPFRQMVELILEIAMQTREIRNDGSFAVRTPAADDELEATLDLIETQAELALFYSMADYSVLYRTISKRALEKTAIRFTDPQAGTKMALRYVTYKTEIDDGLIPVYDSSLTGLSKLPEPFASVAALWADGLPEKEKALALANALPGVTPPDFLGMDTTVFVREIGTV